MSGVWHSELKAQTAAWFDSAGLANPNSLSSTRSFCAGGFANAAGWEGDAVLDPSVTNETAGHESKRSLFRSFQQIAHATPAAAVDMVHGRRAQGGRIFSAGSILFTEALLDDVMNRSGSSRTLTPLLSRVLSQFNRRSTTDFNGNGMPDLIAVSNGQYPGFGIWRYEISRAGAGSIVAGASPVNVPYVAGQIVLPVGDFNGDGASDIVIATAGQDGAMVYSNPALYSYLPGSGNAALSINAHWGAMEQLIPAGDFDNDGFVDVLGRSAGSLYLFRGNGAGGVKDENPRLPIDSGWGAWVSVSSVGDIDNDGNQDILGVRCTGTPLISPCDVVYVRGRGDGTLLPISNNPNAVLATIPASAALQRQYMGIGLFGTVPNTAQEPGAEPWPERPDLLYRQGGTLYRCLASDVDGTSGNPAINVNRCVAIDSGWTFSQLYTVW